MTPEDNKTLLEFQTRLRAQPEADETTMIEYQKFVHKYTAQGGNVEDLLSDVDIMVMGRCHNILISTLFSRIHELNHKLQFKTHLLNESNSYVESLEARVNRLKHDNNLSNF